ncbi:MULTISPECIES: hypothetical protein [Lysinibacillus]|uniref:hypothetical protein n=1 Tax=Lysinibacillus TaxID=400634 RepID=UPI0009F1E0AF|nr:hypothetical protein [Lysinibacillus xylanilyticus]
MKHNTNLTRLDKDYHWLKDVHNKRKERSIKIGIETIDFLVREGIAVTYNNIHKYSKNIDPEGKGIHQNTVSENKVLYEKYKKCSNTYKVNSIRKKTTLPSKFDETSLRCISLERDLKVVKKKYMKMSKDELVNRLIEVEQYVAKNQNRWITNQFEEFK